MVIEFDPVGGGNGSETHGDVVFGTVAKGAVGEGFGGGDGPVGIRGRDRKLVWGGFPFPRLTNDFFNALCCYMVDLSSGMTAKAESKGESGDGDENEWKQK